MKALYIAVECKPFSKVGGVGDVAGELPPALKNQGVDVEIVTPLYIIVPSGSYDDEPRNEYSFPFKGKDGVVQIERVEVFKGKLDGVPVNFVKNETYLEDGPYIFSKQTPFYDDVLRFSFFSEACLHLIRDKNPDIVHVNDWVLGYLFGRMVMENMPQKRVMTVHNIGYQGNIWKGAIKGWQIEEILNDEQVGPLFVDPRTEWDNVNTLRLGLELAHRAHTVSPCYCKEIQKPEDSGRYFEGGKGLHDVTRKLHSEGGLVGILNGFEYKFAPTDKEFNKTLRQKSKMKKALSKYYRHPDAFLLGFVGRAVEQKFKLLTQVIDGKSVLEHILDIEGVNVAILGTGLPEYEAFISNLSTSRFPNLASYTDLLKMPRRENYSFAIAFDTDKAKQISLGSDVFLMPSLFEPCGITQMESLSNATPPLVRWTGGLVDTVRPHDGDDGTGFGFGGSTGEDVLRNLVNAVKEALKVYTQNKRAFRQLQRRGFEERFLWSDAAQEYIERLYQPVLSEK